MTRLIILSPDAQSDIRAAARWYQREESDLGYQFKNEIRLTFRRIIKYPLAFPLVDNLIRRALMKRFPYSIYFIVKSHALLVVAVLHQQRQTL